MPTPTNKSLQLEAAKLAAKLKEQQGVFSASSAGQDGVINPTHHADPTDSHGADNAQGSGQSIGQNNTGSNGQEHGVSAPVYSVRNAAGRFLPGNPGGPGRGTKQRETAIINALNAVVQPELVADVVLGLLTHPNSWRANAAGAEWYGKYMLGPAPQRTAEQENVLDAILIKLRSVQADKSSDG